MTSAREKRHIIDLSHHDVLCYEHGGGRLPKQI
jgi:hypothetical protein